MRHSAEIQRRTARQVRDVSHMRASHHPRVVHRHIREQPVKVHILLRVSVNQVMKCVPSDRQDRLPV